MTTQGELIARMRQSAVEAFGEGEGRHFVNRRMRAFDGRTPAEMAHSPQDAERVFEYVRYLTAAEKTWKAHRIRSFET